ncbi:uncharacterized protein METZ01_LOCUS302503, partial [marine metagenome]
VSLGLSTFGFGSLKILSGTLQQAVVGIDLDAFAHVVLECRQTIGIEGKIDEARLGIGLHRARIQSEVALLQPAGEIGDFCQQFCGDGLVFVELSAPGSQQGNPLLQLSKLPEAFLKPDEPGPQEGEFFVHRRRLAVEPLPPRRQRVFVFTEFGIHALPVIGVKVSAAQRALCQVVAVEGGDPLGKFAALG